MDRKRNNLAAFSIASNSKPGHIAQLLIPPLVRGGGRRRLQITRRSGEGRLDVRGAAARVTAWAVGVAASVGARVADGAATNREDREDGLTGGRGDDNRQDGKDGLASGGDDPIWSGVARGGRAAGVREDGRGGARAVVVAAAIGLATAVDGVDAEVIGARFADR